MSAIASLLGNILFGFLVILLLRYVFLKLFGFDLFNVIADIWNGLLDFGEIVVDAFGTAINQTTKAINSAYKNTLGKVF